MLSLPGDPMIGWYRKPCLYAQSVKVVVRVLKRTVRFQRKLRGNYLGAQNVIDKTLSARL